MTPVAMLPEPELVAEVDQLCRNGRLQSYARKKSQSRQRYGHYRRQRPDVVQVASTASAKALLMSAHTAPDDPASILSCGGATESDDELRRPRTGDQ